MHSSKAGLIKKGFRNPKKAFRYAKSRVTEPLDYYFANKLGVGENVFDYQWDLLIVLDGCHPSIIREVESEYDFIRNPKVKLSVGTNTAEWLIRTFDKRKKSEVNQTAYIHSCPAAVSVFENYLRKNYYGESDVNDWYGYLRRYSNTEIASIEDFGKYIGLYKNGVLTEEGRCVGMKYAPRAITNNAISMDRKENHKRMLLHYMPPHYPYFATRENKTKMHYSSNIYKNINIKDEPREKTFNAYVDNLRWVLEEVEIILNNIDRSKVIITSDHRLPHHKSGDTDSYDDRSFLINERRKVPWIQTSAADNRTHNPNRVEI